jgi:hypothetical protein
LDSARENEFITKLEESFGAAYFNNMQLMTINSAATSMEHAAEWGWKHLKVNLLN